MVLVGAGGEMSLGNASDHLRDKDRPPKFCGPGFNACVQVYVESMLAHFDPMLRGLPGPA